MIMSIRIGLKLSGDSPLHSLLALLASYLSWPLCHLPHSSRGQTASPLPVFTSHSHQHHIHTDWQTEGTLFYCCIEAGGAGMLGGGGMLGGLQPGGGPGKPGRGGIPGGGAP